MRYPDIGRLGVIGDRRTAGLVAADGSLCWLCLPDYDSAPVFAALVDAERGGCWQMGPAVERRGEQRYVERAATLLTTWKANDAELELACVMLEPQTNRPGEPRTVVRRLRSLRGSPEYRIRFEPRDDFEAARVVPDGTGLRAEAGGRCLRLWCSRPLELRAGRAERFERLPAGEEVWSVLTLGASAAESEWTIERARAGVADAEAYWKEWASRLRYDGPRRARVLRSVMTIHLLSYAPTGALVAAPTTSLPERIGGRRNYDYRYAWIRDVSLATTVLSLAGDLEATERYMDWLAGLGSSTQLPLQVLYHVDGCTDVGQHDHEGLEGYRGSRPVRIGNHAYLQHQIGGFGYLADSAWLYLRLGGRWKAEYSAMIRRLADYVARHWRDPGNGIWELAERRHYVCDKIMSWVTLDRAVKIAERTGASGDVAAWRREMGAVRAEIMDRGWSDTLQAFRQRYDADALDASALLGVTMGFLPAQHPRMRATIERIDERLRRGNLVFRFDPEALPKPSKLPMGEAEGAFVPATCWHAAACALLGRPDEACALLDRLEGLAPGPGLLAEEADPVSGVQLGNYPMIFSEAEYVRAVIAYAESRPGVVELRRDLA